MNVDAYDVELGLGLLAGLAGGLWLFSKLKEAERGGRFVAILLGVGIVVAFMALAGEVLMSPFAAWNGDRLAASLGLTHGYRLYYGPDSGPVLSWVYPPLGALVYLPAALARTPTGAIIIGCLLSALLYFGPVAWMLLRNKLKDLHRLVAALALFVCFALVTFDSLLRYGAVALHVDSPALAFATLACAVYCFRGWEGHRLAVFGSALLAVLAIWTKLTLVPLVVALPSFILIAQGWRSAMRYLLYLAMTGLVVSAVLLIAFDPPAMTFWMVGLPIHSPWQFPLSVAAKALAKYSLPALAVIGAFVFLQRTKLSATNWRAWLGGNRWLLFVFAGLCNIPSSLLNRVKTDSDVNSFLPTVCFLTLGALLAVAQKADRAFSNEQDRRPAVLRSLIAISLMCLIVRSAPVFWHLRPILQNIVRNPQELAYDIILADPGSVYFPNHPLAHLLAEGKLYHFSYGLIECQMDGLPVKPDHFRAYCPPKMRSVVFGDLWPSNTGNEQQLRDAVMQYLPEFNVQADSGRWIVYTRN